MDEAPQEEIKQGTPLRLRVTPNFTPHGIELVVKVQKLWIAEFLKATGAESIDDMHDSSKETYNIGR